MQRTRKDVAEKETSTHCRNVRILITARIEFTIEAGSDEAGLREVAGQQV